MTNPKQPRPRNALPIDDVLGEFVTLLKQKPTLVLEAPPGAGKTTRAPLAMLDVVGKGKEIIVGEPRRIAARLAAERAAFELGERPGETVGYSVRFEELRGEKTRVRFVTFGLLLRELLRPGALASVGAVVLDEFHERSLPSDVCLARLIELQRTARPDLRIVVMSATLEGDRLAAELDNCARVRSEGRLFPLTIEHQDKPDDRPLEKQIVSAVRQCLMRESEGDILVFVPGAREIRLAMGALESLAREANVTVFPLHGDLPLKEQVSVLGPSSRRKIVICTNIAEASVTVPGVTTVIDSGLMRQAEHSPYTGVSQLKLVKVSQASAIQRAGRAGRTQPGHVIRLYTRGDFETRAEQQIPEIRRSDLSDTWLLLKAMGVRDPEQLTWLDAPDPKAVAAANQLLSQLGALQPDGLISEVGAQLLKFPVHPRLGRLILEGEARGVGEQACLLAALLTERDIRLESRARGGPQVNAHLEPGPSDALELFERYEQARQANFDASELRYLELDASSVRVVGLLEKQLVRALGSRRRDFPHVPDEQVGAVLCRCLLSGFPDRVARRRATASRELILCNGQTATLSETSVVSVAPLMLALDVEERREGQRGPQIQVRLASAVEADWLLSDYYNDLEFADSLVFEEERGRVEQVSKISYGSVVLEETRTPAAPSEQSTEVLKRYAVKHGSLMTKVLEATAILAGRMAIVARVSPNYAGNNEEWPLRVLHQACTETTRLDELEKLDFAQLALAYLTAEERELLQRLAPERLPLPGGSNVVVHYAEGQEPWIESRLQDFFGMIKSPTVGGGQVPVTVHLLAPNFRPVQVTADLSGFWERHYPSIRKELMRRYPRHAWPENGATATPPPPRPPRTR
ncbi:MAG: ATP-dependent helicase HrpB [Polyangiaceae bacterium]|nr:ATP-dependent helicase HrpB [Polyangiaceae bacterium]